MPERTCTRRWWSLLGHEGCGAVSATVEEMLHKPTELKHIEMLIRLIKPGLKELDLNLERAALLRAAVEANVPLVHATTVHNAGRGTGAPGKKQCKPGRGRIRPGDRAAFASLIR